MRDNDVIQGVGLGLRSLHYDCIQQSLPAIPWFEALTDNYLGQKAIPLTQLCRIRQHYPITLHGVGLSLGSCDELDWDYLRQLKQLIAETEPAWISEHLSWCSIGQRRVPDLLPLPYTDAVVQHVADRIQQVQDFLGQRILIENVSSYIQFEQSDMAEWAFINAILKQADCFLLLDVNNLYVSAMNHLWDPLDYLYGLDPLRIKELHLGGYSLKGGLLFDTHSQPVHEPVWDLYRQTITLLGQVPTLIEWDQDIPSLERVMQEAKKAEQMVATSRTAVHSKLSRHYADA